MQITSKITEGKRASVMVIFLAWSIVIGGMAWLGMDSGVAEKLITFGGSMAGIYFAGQTISDTFKK